MLSRGAFDRARTVPVGVERCVVAIEFPITVVVPFNCGHRKQPGGCSRADAALPPPPAPLQAKPATIIPKEGTYIYSQSGTEKFCSGAACSPSALPDHMTATITRPAPSQVVLEWKIADGRIIRTTSAFTSSLVEMQEWYAEFQINGITQSQTVRPQPPMKVASLPLAVGSSHSGSFSDQQSNGTYSFAITSNETVTAAGKPRQTKVLQGTVTVNGPRSGTIKLTAWIDPSTNVFVKLHADLDSHYGAFEYQSSFTDTLQQGPQA